MSQVSCHHGSFYLCKQCSFTHNELLQRVKDIPTTRAVVELHKPSEIDFPDEDYFCEGCSNNKYAIEYPCRTIQIIEKELA